MKLQQILSNFQKLHPKEIDLSLDRIKNLCEKKLGNPQDKIKVISVCGTNGKGSTIESLYAILKEANFKCNVFKSPHVQKLNERYIFNNQELSDDELADLLEKVEKINDNQKITVFEILTACFFYKAAQYPDNINLVEAGLFYRFDATNILKSNLASIVTSISKDHLDWLPKDKQTVEQIVFEKTSALLNSNIIVAKQNNKTLEYIKKTIKNNSSNKLFFNEDFSYSIRENGFFYYEDKFGGLKLPLPNVLGQFQLENISTSIATLRTLNLGIETKHIERGIQKINNLARLQEIKSGKLKELVKDNKLLVSGDHNPDGARVLNEYLQSLDCNKHIILGMMGSKDHQEFISYFKNIKTLTTIDIHNQPNSIKGEDLKNKIKNYENIQYKENIFEAIKSIPIKKNDLILITGSLYLAGEVLNLN